jgi:hypothetical protein
LRGFSNRQGEIAGTRHYGERCRQEGRLIVLNNRELFLCLGAEKEKAPARKAKLETAQAPGFSFARIV